MKFQQSLAFFVSLSVIGIASIPAQAGVLSFDTTNGIKFDTDTTLNLTFLSSRGRKKSTFGVAEVNGSNVGTITTLFSEEGEGFDPGGSPANDFRGSCGITVIPKPCEKTYKFLANKVYTFTLNSIYAESQTPSADYQGEYTIYSTTSLNTQIQYPIGTVKCSPPSDTTKQCPFGTQAQIPTGNLSSGVNINFEDRAEAALTTGIDYNDFVVKAETTPEPSALTGLGLIAGCFFMFRRRKS